MVSHGVMDTAVWLIIVVVVVFAGFTQGVADFGFGVVRVLFGSMVLPPVSAVGVDSFAWPYSGRLQLAASPSAGQISQDSDARVGRVGLLAVRCSRE